MLINIFYVLIINGDASTWKQQFTVLLPCQFCGSAFLAEVRARKKGSVGVLSGSNTNPCLLQTAHEDIESFQKKVLSCVHEELWTGRIQIISAT